ncbi:MAG TPA: carboxyvinyl-carboxyphosphonate phosphorylmutase [Rhodobacteraceae bacterium]|nr:carboxyvinyl-carboxyphosphonate phosphorylmutase [Paracoccaceae bacterium]
MSKTQLLRELITREQLDITPCCGDPLGAKLIEQAGFPLAFMSGFCVSAQRLGLPDTGLISSTEMIDQGRNIASAITIPVIGDGDTGFGNALNIKRLVNAYADAGLACIMLEDQVSPKRCGHTQGKQVVNREEAMIRIQAAVDARNEGADILILARTDARESLGLEEAIERGNQFYEIGADLIFIEAPQSTKEMEAICQKGNGPQMANILEGGKTPILSQDELQAIGFSIAAYPLTSLMASICAIQASLQHLKNGEPEAATMPFESLQNILGFDQYFEQEKRYS